MTDPRAQFLTLLFSQPLRRADAIVCLAGEDGQERAKVALQLFKQGAAPMIVVTGGLHDGKRLFGAEYLAGWLMGQGVAPDRIITETMSRNTSEQAASIKTDWTGRPLLLVASAYHLPRAFLTFILRYYKQELIITPVAATPPWCEAPPGASKTRLELLADEFAKIEEYGQRGHVVGYEEGIAYLQRWESHGQTQKVA